MKSTSKSWRRFQLASTWRRFPQKIDAKSTPNRRQIDVNQKNENRKHPNVIHVAHALFGVLPTVDIHYAGEEIHSIMGFYHLRHDLNVRSDCKSTVVFDWITDNEGDKPWIVIDYNNIILSMKTTGGHLMLLEWRLKLFWESLAKCGAKICIVKDGTHFSHERTILKLKQFRGKSTIPNTKSASLPDSKLDRHLAYGQCEKVLNEIFMGSLTSDIEDDNEDTNYINHKADGEADPAI